MPPLPGVVQAEAPARYQALVAGADPGVQAALQGMMQHAQAQHAKAQQQAAQQQQNGGGS
jgi:hypothetical protein